MIQPERADVLQNSCHELTVASDKGLRRAANSVNSPLDLNEPEKPFSGDFFLQESILKPLSVSSVRWHS
jgi:hypothetical protein